MTRQSTEHACSTRRRHAHATWDSYPLTAERLRRYDEAFPVMRAACAKFGLDLRRGFEVYPGALPDSADLRDYGLGQSGGVSDRVPRLLDAGAGRARARPNVRPSAPSRPACCPCSRIRSAARRSSRIRSGSAEFVDRGWLLALNGMSLDGRHGPKSQAAAWELLEAGYGDLVASDAHA